MKKVIAVWGAANTGKTKSIKRAYTMLTDAYPGAEVEEFWNGVDITVVITAEGAKLGIESQGDPTGQRLKKSLQRFVDIGCQLIICATRTRGSTCKVVEEFRKKNEYELEWLEKCYVPPENWECGIESTAQDIFRATQAFLANGLRR